MSSLRLKNVSGDTKDLPLAFGSKLTVGRSKLTGIKDRRLSRSHLVFSVGRDGETVALRHVGQNRSVVNGKAVRRGFEGLLRPGDAVELLEGKFRFELSRKHHGKMASSQSGHWSKGLMASMADPENVLYSDEEVCMIRDKYPKAKLHWLVLPKDERLNSMRDLGRQHVELVQKMLDVAERRVAETPFTDVRFGFHAVPSMAGLHMHVVSQDFVSPCLKHKKHWNSFNGPYFVPAEAVVRQLRETGKVAEPTSEESKAWLKRDLKCHRCSHVPANIPELKRHLESHERQSS